MKHFLLSEHDELSFSASVLATTAARPGDFLGEVTEALRERQVTGAVLFDLLLTNGSPRQRFFVATFDGLELSDLRPVEDKEVASAASRCAAPKLQTYQQELDMSLLSPAMRFAVSVGRPM